VWWVDLIGLDWSAIAGCDVCNVESGTVELVGSVHCITKFIIVSVD